MIRSRGPRARKEEPYDERWQERTDEAEPGPSPHRPAKAGRADRQVEHEERDRSGEKKSNHKRPPCARKTPLKPCPPRPVGERLFGGHGWAVSPANRLYL